MRKTIGVLASLALLLTAFAAPASAQRPVGSDAPVEWDGVRGTDSEKCELAEEDGARNIETGWLHWVLTPGGPTDVTEAELEVNGQSVGTMTPQGQAGALQLFMPFVEPVSAIATPSGALGSAALLTISDWCAGEPNTPPPGNGGENGGENGNGNGEENGENGNVDDVTEPEEPVEDEPVTETPDEPTERQETTQPVEEPEDEEIPLPTAVEAGSGGELPVTGMPLWLYAMMAVGLALLGFGALQAAPKR